MKRTFNLVTAWMKVYAQKENTCHHWKLRTKTGRALNSLPAFPHFPAPFRTLHLSPSSSLEKWMLWTVRAADKQAALWIRLPKHGHLSLCLRPQIPTESVKRPPAQVLGLCFSQTWGSSETWLHRCQTPLGRRAAVGGSDAFTSRLPSRNYLTSSVAKTHWNKEHSFIQVVRGKLVIKS